MRLLLKLLTKDTSLSLNYNFFLSSAINKLLQFDSPQFSKFLHQRGYPVDGKMYRLFSFALIFEKTDLAYPAISILSPQAKLYITSPIVDDFIRSHFIRTFHNQSLEILEHSCKISFTIEQIESLPDPVFGEVNYFKPLSPFILSVKRAWRHKFTQYYFRYTDDITEINAALNENLKSKYEMIYKKPYAGKDVTFAWDENYISAYLQKNKKLIKKITLLKRGFQPVEYIGNKIPFTLTGSKELINVGYQCGFGEKTSMGFGLVEAVNNYELRITN